jgi:ATP-dependent helicase IRC3
LEDQLDLSEVRIGKQTGDFSTASLAEVISRPEICQLVFNGWKENASERKATLVFGISVHHVEALAETFRANGIDARSLTSGTSSTDRIHIMDDFKAGRFPVLVNCAILTEVRLGSTNSALYQS